MITKVRVQFDKLLADTGRAYLIRIASNEFWLPSKMCWNVVINKKLGGNLVIPTWLYKDKFGCDPNEYEAETIIENHVPVRIEPKKIDVDGSLVR